MGKALESALQAIKKKYGETSVFKGSEKIALEVETIPTGSLALDAALLVGGYPKGRIIEVSGPESGGKSFLCLMAIKQAQKQGIKCAFIDAEHTLDRRWCTQLGINVDELLIAQPDSFEEALNIIMLLAKSGEVGLIVFDSVPSLPTKAESDKEIGEATIGTHARILTVALRKMTPLFHEQGVTGLFINQLRDKIGGYGNPETTPGGRALKHGASVRIGVTRVGGSDIKEGERLIGHRIRAKVKKNKVSTAQGVDVEFTIFYSQGIDWTDEIMTVGLQTGIIVRVNKSTYAIGKETFRGQDAVAEYLKKNPEVVKDLEVKVKEAMKNGVVRAPEVLTTDTDASDDSDEVLGKDEDFLKLEE